LFIKKRSIYNELLVGTDDVFSVVSDIVMKMKKVKLLEWIMCPVSICNTHFLKMLGEVFNNNCTIGCFIDLQHVVDNVIEFGFSYFPKVVARFT